LPSVGEDGAGQGQVGHQSLELFDLGVLVGDGLLELGDGFSELPFGLRDLLGSARTR
jgi:hypothetical protein